MMKMLVTDSGIEVIEMREYYFMVNCDSVLFKDTLIGEVYSVNEDDKTVSFRRCRSKYGNDVNKVYENVPLEDIVFPNTNYVPTSFSPCI